MRLFILGSFATVITALPALPAAAVTIPGTPAAAASAQADRLPDDWLEDVDDAPDRSHADSRESADLAASDAGRATPPPECRASSGTTGAILGAVAGGLLGNVIDGGRHRALGTLAGAGGGALLGRDIEKKRAACN